MIGALLMSAILLQNDRVTVSYTGVPPEVERVVVYRWLNGAAPIAPDAQAVRSDPVWSIAAPAGTDVVVFFLRRDEGYLVDGPFRWPSSATVRTVDRIWRRAIRVALLEGTPVGAELEWLSSDGSRDAWPVCVRDGPLGAVCHGVPLSGSGIVFTQAFGRTWWSVVAGRSAGAMHVSTWGRLLVMRFGPSPPSGLRAALAHPVQSAQRARNIRLQTSKVPGAGAMLVPPAALWAYGDDVPGGAWIEVHAARAGPVYLPLEDLAAAPSSLPLHVALDDARAVDGAVLDASAAPAGGSLVTVFRLLAAPPVAIGGRGQDPPPRVFVAEAIAGRDGAFAFDGLGAADYEIVAWHPQRGRASIAIGSRARVEIRLESAGTIRGRVLSGGKPAAGVDVISVVDAAAARDGRDLVDLAGGNVRTGPDGRFVVTAAAAGGGALRIGGGPYPIRRIPLPRDPARTLDLGDVELGAAIDITVSLDDDPGCELRAAGPVGRPGLLLVAGVRTAPGLYRISIPEGGEWEFTLSCAGVERALSPSLRQITSALAGKEVRFTVR